MAATGYTSGDPRKVDISGDAMTGELTLPDSSPDTALSAASKGYVDNATGAHVSGSDPHGDRAYADAKFATIIVVTAQGDQIATLDEFVQDCLTRVAAIEGGTAYLAGLNVDGSATVANGNLTVTDFVKGYRFRTDGDALDLEGTGKDLILSVWSGSGFNGDQRSYARLSSDAQNIQWQGPQEFVAALYGAAVHRIDPASGVASLGAKNGLTNLRFCGLKNSPGAPTTGAWLVGDLVLDSAGSWHLCTAAGTPGSWT